MKTLIISLGFIFLFSIQNAFSQIDKNVLIKSKGKFYYQDQVYKKGTLGELFKLNEPSLNYYKKHRKARKVFKISGISTLVLAGGGLILLSIDGEENQTQGEKCYEFCPHQIFGLRMFLVSWLPAAATIISFPISRRNYKKSIKSFHTYTESNPKLGSSPIELNFNYTGNGVGLVLNF